MPEDAAAKDVAATKEAAAAPPGARAPGEAAAEVAEGRPEDALEERLHRLALKMDEVAWRLQRMDVAEFAEYYRRPRRVILVSFATGVARGVGIAVGFTLLGALVLWLLRSLLVLNLPGLGHFLAQLIRIINSDLSVRP